ncbi:MAG: GatB/YqeY domain-containing protein [Proteobacteria bacterium]|nr:GatB/YqeY domain-containing protein [Burkholderiales bacterium]
MRLRETIQNDMKAALRNRETERLSTIRLLWAAVRQREVDERKELVDGEIVAAIERMIKQRRDSIAQFEQGGRLDLAGKEARERDVLQAYLPAALTPAEIDSVVAGALAEVAAAAGGPTTIADLGKVMALLKPRLAGRADLGAASGAVKARLAG